MNRLGARRAVVREHRLIAIDIGVETAIDVAGGGPGAPPDRPRLALHEAIVRHHAPAEALRVETESAVPAGSGLGGSSALAVALLAATAAHAGREVDRARLAPLARDIEAGVLEIPTGTQDHLAAIHGGVAAIRHDDGIHLWAGAVATTPLRLEHVALPEESALSHDEQYSAWFRRHILASLRDDALAALPTPNALTD